MSQVRALQGSPINCLISFTHFTGLVARLAKNKRTKRTRNPEKGASSPGKIPGALTRRNAWFCPCGCLGISPLAPLRRLLRCREHERTSLSPRWSCGSAAFVPPLGFPCPASLNDACPRPIAAGAACAAREGQSDDGETDNSGNRLNPQCVVSLCSIIRSRID